MDIELFNKYCGEILRIAIEVESSLELFIGDYFFYPVLSKEMMFMDLILYNLSMERKKAIIKEICKQENIEDKKTTELTTKIKKIQSIRNKVAHCEAGQYSNGNIRLEPKKSLWNVDETLIINHELVKEVKTLSDSTHKLLQNISSVIREKEKIEKEPWEE